MGHRKTFLFIHFWYGFSCPCTVHLLSFETCYQINHFLIRKFSNSFATYALISNYLFQQRSLASNAPPRFRPTPRLPSSGHSPGSLCLETATDWSPVSRASLVWLPAKKARSSTTRTWPVKTRSWCHIARTDGVSVCIARRKRNCETFRK